MLDNVNESDYNLLCRFRKGRQKNLREASKNQQEWLSHLPLENRITTKRNRDPERNIYEIFRGTESRQLTRSETLLYKRKQKGFSLSRGTTG
jgi:hypothetical protein